MGAADCARAPVIIGGCRTDRRSCSSSARAWHSWPSRVPRSSTSSRAASTRAAPRGSCRCSASRPARSRTRSPPRPGSRASSPPRSPPSPSSGTPERPTCSISAHASCSSGGAAGGPRQRSVAALPQGHARPTAQPQDRRLLRRVPAPVRRVLARPDRAADPRPGHHLHAARRAQRRRLRRAGRSSGGWIRGGRRARSLLAKLSGGVYIGLGLTAALAGGGHSRPSHG